jgi:predicted nucleic acid-binding protein
MRFVDSNVFLHAFLSPRRELTQRERATKESAKEIVERIEAGETVATSTVHLSEVVNVVESGLGLQESLGLLAWAVSRPNVSVYPTRPGDYEAALPVAKDRGVSPNDALAYTLMRQHGIDEIYTFDRHFNQLTEVTRLPQVETSNVSETERQE